MLLQKLIICMRSDSDSKMQCRSECMAVTESGAGCPTGASQQATKTCMAEGEHPHI